jgi:hypothetical protein
MAAMGRGRVREIPEIGRRFWNFLVDVVGTGRALAAKVGGLKSALCVAAFTFKRSLARIPIFLYQSTNWCERYLGSSLASKIQDS